MRLARVLSRYEGNMKDGDFNAGWIDMRRLGGYDPYGDPAPLSDGVDYR
jgi:hypothetical protein